MITRALREAPELVEDDGRRKLRGYIAKFNAESYELWDDRIVEGEPFVEIIRPGAFDGVLGEDIRALFNHDKSLVLGRTTNGTLRLKTDDVGLFFEVDLDDTTVAQDAWKMVKRRDIDGCSFCFDLDEDMGHEVIYRANQVTLHEITQFTKIIEVSPAVTFPAYEQTESYARNRDRAQEKKLRLARSRAIRQRALWSIEQD